jgi:alpha-glucosidase (family GH31 glycosyl hydrolase)
MHLRLAAASAVLTASLSVAHATEAAGPVLPPKWAFGVLYGSYFDQAQVLDAMSRIRNGYSGDVLWVDSSWLSSQYNDAPSYITFKFDTSQFPDAKGMIATLHANHFRFGVWEWPYIDKSNSLFKFGDSHSFFIEDGKGKTVDGGGWHGVTFTGQFDFTNSGAQNWWKTLHQPLLDMGLDFFKIDTNGTVAKSGVLADGQTSDSHYRLMYHKTVFEVTQAASHGRGFLLAHHQGTAGNDQFPGVWTGDIASTWDGFGSAMSTASKLDTTSTAVYWTGDTGGYKSGNPSDELYIRWLQFGTLSPITEFFAEKKSKTRFPWIFGAQAQDIFKMYTRLRYRLLPFRYSNAQIAFHESPVRYPVSFVSGTTDEMLVGSGDSQILVAPVHTQGATSRIVKLPSGSWINYWTGKVSAGGTSPSVAAPLDKVPMFVKAGSIIPMGPDIEWVDQKPADPLTLDIYPAGATSYTLYEDDGISNDYLTGGFSKTTLSCDDTHGVEISIAASTGTYTGKLTARTYVLKVNSRPQAPVEVLRDGAAMTEHATQADFDAASEGWFHDAAADIVWVKFRISTSTATSVTL